MSNIKEEINRIKSLFTEERLYGNLSEQDINPDTDGNEKISSTEFTAIGRDMTKGDAAEFLRDMGYSIQKISDVDDDTVLGVCMKKEDIKNSYNQLADSGGTLLKDKSSSLYISVSSTGGICYFSANKKRVSNANINVNKLSVWDNGNISFYVTLPHTIKLDDVSEAKKSFLNLITPFRAELSLGLGTGDTVKYLRFSAKYDFNTKKYSSIEFLDFWSQSGSKDVDNNWSQVLINQFESPDGYNPESGGSRIYGTGDTNGLSIQDIITSSNGLSIPLTGSITNIIDKL